MELVTKVGYCRYCNNGKMREVPNDEDLTQEYLNEMITEECDCYGATKARKKKFQREACLANIDKMLSGSRPDIAEIFKECIDALQENKIKKNHD